MAKRRLHLTFTGKLVEEPILWQLSQNRHEIVIITTKPFWAIHDTFAWIAQHRIPTREVHIKDVKWTVACDLYLDDGPHVIESLVKHRPRATVCRFVRPWNHPVPGAQDVTDWQEFVEEVDMTARHHR